MDADKTAVLVAITAAFAYTRALPGKIVPAQFLADMLAGFMFLDVAAIVVTWAREA